MSSSATKRIVVLFFSFLILTQLSLHAQADKRTYTGGRSILTHENISLNISSLRQTDTVINGRISYMASITFNMSEDAGRFMMKLQQLSSKGATAPITITSTDFDYKPEEITIYQDASMREISFSALDGASKDLATATISFTAQNMKQGAADGKAALAVVNKQKATLASNFRFTLGNLPANRIAAVERISVLPNGTIRIALSQADQAAWKEVFYSGKGQRLQGSIEFLAPDMKQVILKIELKDVDLVSWSKEMSSGTEQIIRPKIGLRPKQLVIVAN